MGFYYNKVRNKIQQSDFSLDLILPDVYERHEYIGKCNCSLCNKRGEWTIKYLVGNLFGELKEMDISPLDAEHYLAKGKLVIPIKRWNICVWVKNNVKTSLKG